MYMKRSLVAFVQGLELFIIVVSAYMEHNVEALGKRKTKMQYKDVVQVFYAPDLENNEGRHIVLQGKWKIVSVDNTTEEGGNGYQDMPTVRADVDLRLFEEGVEPMYVRVDHDEAIIIVP